MTSEKVLFAAGDLVVYPTHGVGKIVGIETQEIAGHTLNVFVVHFDKDRMTLRVPLAKAKVSGLRRLSSRKEMDAALAKLRGRSRLNELCGAGALRNIRPRSLPVTPVRLPRWFVISTAMSVSQSNPIASDRSTKPRLIVSCASSLRSSGLTRLRRPSESNSC